MRRRTPDVYQTMNVLLVEDDQALADVLCDFLCDEQHVVALAEDLHHARALMRTSAWDVCVIEPPGTSYLEVAPTQVEDLRRLANEGPVVVLSGRAWVNRTEASDLGVEVPDAAELSSSRVVAGGPVRQLAT